MGLGRKKKNTPGLGRVWAIVSGLGLRKKHDILLYKLGKPYICTSIHIMIKNNLLNETQTAFMWATLPLIVSIIR